MDDCRADAYRLSSASSTVSMTVLVVFSMLSLSCGVDDLRSCRRRLALNSLRGLKELFPHRMSALLSGRSAHVTLSFVAQFVVIWLITYQTEGLVRS
jgi:hypothetical protein